MSVQLIQNVIARKKEQQPQMDYLWRVELPPLMPLEDTTSSGVVGGYLNQVAMTQKPGIGGLIARASNTINNISNAVNNAINAGVSAAQGILGQLGLNAQSIPISTPGGISDTDAISSRVYDVSTPMKNFSSERAIYMGRSKSKAGRRDIGNLTMDIDEMEDGATLAYILAWQSLIENPDGTRNPSAYYKHPIRFINVSATKLDLNVVEYIGCWPTEVSPVSRSYDGNGIAKFSVTFAVDDMIVTPVSNATALIQSVEDDILMQEYRLSGFNLGSFDLDKQNKILRRIAGLVL